MIDSGSALMIVGAALQAVPVGRAVAVFVTGRLHAAGVGRALSIDPSARGGLRSSN